MDLGHARGELFSSVPELTRSDAIAVQTPIVVGNVISGPTSAEHALQLSAGNPLPFLPPGACTSAPAFGAERKNFALYASDHFRACCT